MFEIIDLKKRRIKKTIAIAISIVMVFNFIPLNVFATVIANEEIVETKEAPKEENKEEAVIIGELEEKRTINEKHYLMSDGTVIASVYNSNIHYETKEGKLKQIDNTLETKEDKKDSLKIKDEKANETNENINKNRNETVENFKKEIKEKEEEINLTPQEKLLQQEEKIKDTKIYKNRANGFNVNFTNKTNEYNLGSIEKDGYKVTWGLKNSKASVINIKNPNTNNKNIKGKKAKEIEANEVLSAVAYDEILSNTKIEYVVESEQVKENITLKNKNAAKNNLVFEYDTGNLQMKQLENKEIIIYENSEENIKFRITAPYMYDGKLEFSSNIDVKLEKQENKYILTLIPNKEWLEDKNRKYPVVIDPTINTPLHYEKIQDTYIYSGDTGNNTRHNAHILRVGSTKFTVSGGPYRSLIKFTLPTLNSGDQIIDARFNLYNYPDTDEWTPPTESKYIDVHKITTSWDQASANWNNMNANYDSKITDYAIYQFANYSRNVFDITSIVKDWYVNGANNGIMLKDHTETWSPADLRDGYFLSADTNAAYATYRPMVQITYRNQTGIEDYLDYHMQDVGRAGTIYTNDYNGNLVLLHGDLGTPGTRLPAAISHVYNTNDRAKDIGYGYGYRLNLSQELSYEDINMGISVAYSSNIQDQGWETAFSKYDGATSGTLGQSKRLEAIQIKLINAPSNAKIKYQAHVQDVGWQAWTENGGIAGTAGQSKRLEAIKIQLENMANLTVTYRAHIENIGWQAWKQNGEEAGTTGQNLRIEALEIKVVQRYIKYIDEDGTAHYFENSSGTYKDEDGLGLTLAANGTTWIMTDKQANKSTFNKYTDGTSRWYLKEIKDEAGNKITTTVSFANGNTLITSVIDGVGDKLTLTYTNNRLSKITNPGTQAITYTYNSSGNLVEITYPDSKKSTYTYSSNLLTSAKNIDNSRVDYTYYGGGPAKVKTIKKYGTDGSAGENLTITYGNNLTKFVDNKGYSNTHSFNNYGQAVNIADFGKESSNLNNAYGKMYQYGTSGGTKNKLTLESNLINTSSLTGNLLTNGNFENGLTGWTKNGSCDGNDTVITEGTNKVMRIVGNVTKDKAVTQTLNISGKKGDIFNISAWAKTIGIPRNGNKWAQITVEILSTDNVSQWIDASIYANNGEWQFISNDFIAAKDYKKVAVNMYFFYNVQNVLFDNIGLYKDVSGTSYTYDAKGNVISSVDSVKQKETLQYDGNDNLIKNINPKGGEINYTYDATYKHRLTKAVTGIGLTYNITYNSYRTSNKCKNNRNNRNKIYGKPSNIHIKWKICRNNKKQPIKPNTIYI